jgi:hypothetical protein
LGAGLVLLIAAPAAAQKLTLNVTPRAITFPSADPDTTPVVSASPVTVQVRIQQNGGKNGTNPWQLTVLANGDLISGSSTVDISNVTWTATPAPPFQDGTLNRTIAQRLASGTGDENPPLNGSITFHLVNSWTYSAGTYSQTLVFTLSVP